MLARVGFRRCVNVQSLRRPLVVVARYQSTVVPTTPPLPPTPTPTPVKKKDSSIPLIVASFLLGAGVASLFSLSEVADVIAFKQLPAPGTPEARAFQEKLEIELSQLELFHKLAMDPDYESVRAWSYLDSNTLNASITSGTLSVPGGFAIKPALFVNKKKGEIIAFIHLGQKLCGYPFLVHGGILATILDEVLKRGSSFKFGIDPLDGYTPDKIKTNKIELQYKFPTLANNFVVVRTSINEKGQVIGDIETTSGRPLVKGVGEFEKRKGKFLGLF